MVGRIVAYMSLFAWPAIVMFALHTLSDGQVGLGLREYVSSLIMYVVFGNSHLRDQIESIRNLN